MKRGLIFLALAVILIFINLSVINSVKSDTNIKIDNAVYEKLQHEGKVRVIVNLKEDKEIAKFKIQDKGDIKNREEFISSLSTLPEDEFKLVYKAHSVNGFTAEVSASALEELKKNSAIKYVKVEPEVRLALQDSVPMINATLVWPKQVSLNNITGEGQTICIVDTGINYTHPDLGGCLGMNCRVLGGYAFNNPFNSSNKTDVMDDNGHGTHVAGIAGANGSIKGVAIGVKFVSVKACGPTSSCGWQNIIDSVNWCVGNSSLYNISVISMSLGTSQLFTSYCDTYDSDMTAAVDAAIAKNITVVVATGNDGNVTAISNPACIRNSTAVGAVSKSDAVSYNRNNITTVLAPGLSITSTSVNGGTTSMSGTSMATPHVSGAVALLKQYKKLEKNDNLTTARIKDVLNRTGKVIADSGSGLNLSRLNVYAALVSIDETAPLVNISQPQNRTYTSNTSFSLNFSASDNLNLTSCWYSLDSTSNITLVNCQNSSFNATEGSHVLQVYANDSAGNENSTTIVFNVNLNPIVNLLSPNNATSTAISSQIFSCNASASRGLQNLTLYVWNSTALVHTNSTNVSGTYNQTNFSFALPYESIFKWNCRATDNESNRAFAGNYTITYDLTAPNVTLISPENGTNYTASGNISFSFNVTDLSDIANCSLIINSALNSTVTSPTRNVTNSISIALNNAAYNWSTNCTDNANNVGASSKWQLTINVSTTIDYNISACRNITQAGTYTLNKSITNWNSTTGQVCINISVNDVEIDCIDFSNWLDGSDTTLTYGIKAEGTTSVKLTNITARNCNLTDWHAGIYYNYIENSTITNITSLDSSSFGIFVNGSSVNSIGNITAGNTNDDGIFLSSGSNYNILTNITVLNNSFYGIYILYQSNHNRIFKATFINNKEGFASASSINNTIYNATYTNNTDTDINASHTSIELRDTRLANYSFVNTTVTIKNSSAAIISFPNITVTNGTNFSADIMLRNNYVFVNSSSARGLNRSANITFLNLNFNNPRILRDSSACPASICTKITYNSSNGTLIFKVTSFSAYSAEDYCGNSNCEAGESCSSCSADCGACAVSISSSGGGGGGGSGGATGKTYVEGAMKEGKEINRLLEKNDKIKFELRNKEHNLTAKFVSKENVTFELNSISLKFTLATGESRKFNLTDSKFYDLFIRLNSITNLKANLSITAIFERMPVQIREIEIVKNVTNISEQIKLEINITGEAKEKVLGRNKIILLWITAVLLVIILAVLFKRHRFLKERRVIGIIKKRGKVNKLTRHIKKRKVKKTL